VLKGEEASRLALTVFTQHISAAGSGGSAERGVQDGALSLQLHTAGDADKFLSVHACH